MPDEQKGCRRGSRGTKDQLLIDKAVLRDCKRRSTNLAMAWIDFRKAYDMVPHSWILECLELFGVANNIRIFLQESMEIWKTELTVSGETLGNVEIRRGIFQGDSLSPLLFVLCMIPMTLTLRREKVGYQWEKGKYKINHLVFMDDFKLFGKSHDQIDSLVQTVYMLSKDIGMEFGLKKCGVLIMKRGKVVTMDGIRLPDGGVMKEIDEHGYKYLGIIEMDKIKEKEMKDAFTKEYKRRLKLVLKSKLNGRFKIMAINTWAVAVLRYGAGIIKWLAEDLRQLDRSTRKMMTMNGALHPKSDVHRLYVPRKKGGRGLVGCEGCVRTEENNLGWYIKNSEEKLLQGVRAVGVIETEAVKSNNDFKEDIKNANLNSWKEKRMHGQFLSEMNENVDRDKCWEWLRKGDLKVQTEALICAAQEQALRTNYIKYNIDKTSDSPYCRLCGQKGETVNHIISECTKLAQREYKRRHDKVGKIVHWKLCKKYNLERKEKWYEHEPESVMENDVVKILWDVNIQCDHVIQARRPDIVVIEKEERICKLVDIAVPGDSRICDKEVEKLEKYQDLKREVGRLWNMKKVVVVPVVIGALGCVSKDLKKWIESLDIQVNTAFLQKTALLGTARILRRVLES